MPILAKGGKRTLSSMYYYTLLGMHICSHRSSGTKYKQSIEYYSTFLPDVSNEELLVKGMKKIHISTIKVVLFMCTSLMI